MTTPSSSLQEQNVSIMSSFTGSKKVYIQGSRKDIQVPMREIGLSPLLAQSGKKKQTCPCVRY